MSRLTATALAAGTLTVVIVGGGFMAAANGTDRGTAARASGNAQKLDGMDSTEFAYAKGKTGAYDAPGVLLDLDENGSDDAIAASLACPRGTQLTGGGGGDFSTTGVMVLNAPGEGESWITAVFIQEGAQEDPTNVFASVICYSAHGNKLSGSYRPSTTIPSAALAKLKTASAARR